MNWSKMESVKDIVLKQPPVPTSLSGFYEQDRSINPDSPLGLNFLDDNKVEMYSGSEKLGDTVSYTINGKSLEVKHACGVWKMKIRDDNKLYHEEFNCDFIKKE